MKTDESPALTPSPLPQTKPDTAPDPSMLTSAEFEELMQHRKEHFEFLKKRYPNLRMV